MSANSILSYLPVNLATALISFGTITILTRLLTSAEFGLYALAVISVEFVHLAVFSWIEAAMARFWARADRQNRLDDFVKSLLSFCFIYGLVMVVSVLLIVYCLPLEARTKTVFLFALGALSLRNLSCLFQESHMAAERSKRFSMVYTSITAGGFMIGIVLILLTPLRETAPFIGILIALSVSMFFEIPFMLKLAKGGTYDRAYISQAARYGVPISLSLVLTYVLTSSDMYLVAYFLGWDAAGVYNAGYNLANRSMDVMFVWLNMALTPLVVKAAENDNPDDVSRLLETFGTGLLWIALPMATGLALVAEPAGIVFGESVREGAIKIIPYIAFAGAAHGLLTYYVHKAFILSERTGAYVWALIVPVVTNLLLNIFLIPEFGLTGAVASTCIAYAIGLVCAYLIGRQCYPLPLPVRAFCEISFCCLVMAVFITQLSFVEGWPDLPRLLLKTAAGITAYGAVSLLINSGNCRDVASDMYRRIRMK